MKTFDELEARWLLLETLLAPLMNVLMIFIRMDNRKARR